MCWGEVTIALKTQGGQVEGEALWTECRSQQEGLGQGETAVRTGVS